MYQVLIVDDEAIIRKGIKHLFDWSELGFEIASEAATGEQALHEITCNNPDVVLMDIRMPVLSGLEVLHQARENGFHGKVIIVSGHSDFSYAQQAIRYGVQYYLTKPIDEDELCTILRQIKVSLDEECSATAFAEHYRNKARNTIVTDILLGQSRLTEHSIEELGLNADTYQVVIYEKYGHDLRDMSYRFSDLLRVTNQENNSYESVEVDYNEVILLKGRFAIQKFNDFLGRYEREQRPQKGSPLDTLFITYGRCVDSLEDVSVSYNEACSLLHRRFFCTQGQHTIGYTALPAFQHNQPLINEKLMSHYAEKLLNYIQAFNRNMVAETLSELSGKLYNTSDSIDSIKLFLADLFLQIKERMNHLYNTASIPFPRNSEIIKFINDKYYLYEIILFFTEQFEIIMSALGNSNRESVLDDILHYIAHNYANNITLENIAPLFGYNSSYLGKIFSKKMGQNFNTYLDHVRIAASKELLLHEDMKVYAIAENVGYKNVDYFHVKFKKYVGMSPAEFRKANKPTASN